MPKNGGRFGLEIYSMAQGDEKSLPLALQFVQPAQSRTQPKPAGVYLNTEDKPK